jgi:O-acetylhomoserine/O-acetylserine sulfhydrylase-like pyridoxal-dependent enzyme
MSETTAYGPGVMKYVEEAKKLIAERDDQIARAKKWKFDTIAVHGLYSLEESYARNQGALVEPLYLSDSQHYRDADELEAALAYLVPTWCYTRFANPTTSYLEWTLALLESYKTGVDASCVVTASGMAAISLAVDPFLVPESTNEKINFASCIQVYGGTFQFFRLRKARERGIEVRWVGHPERVEDWASQIDEKTRFLYMEAPSNPQQAFCDFRAVADLAHKRGIPFIVDATCATPALMRPLVWGADIVVHSLTKSMTMSGTAVGGALISRKPITTNVQNDHPLFKTSFAEYVKFNPHRDYGPAAAPFNAMMTLNDLRTLRSRMDLVSRNCQSVAEWLATHPNVYQVDYLGLPSHRLHPLAEKHMFLVDSDDGTGREINRYGHLLGFRVEGPPAKARKVYDGFKMISRATDLGKFKSVATIPAISTHQQQGEEARAMADVPPQLIRLCVGAEDPADVIADLEQALKRL